MARTIEMYIREKYMCVIRNKLLIEYIGELRVEVDQLEEILPFDEPENLSNLYKIKMYPID